MNRTMLIAGLVVAAVAGALIYGARRGAPRQNFFSGVVEAREYDLAFEISGTIKDMRVDEGDPVVAGKPLAHLDARQLRAEVLSSQAALGKARAELKRLEAGSRPQEIASARDRVGQARANLEQLINGATAEQLREARARMQAARARYQEQHNGFRPEEVASARAAEQAARSDMQTARADLVRYRALFREKEISEQQFEATENRYQQARGAWRSAAEQYRKMRSGYRKEQRRAAYNDYRAARAAYQDLAKGTRPELIAAARAELHYQQQQLSLAVAGPRREDIEAAQRAVQQAQAQLQAVTVRLSKTALRCPADGVVTARPLEPGETVGAGVPVLKVSEVAHPWVFIFVPETEIGQLRLGQLCQIKVDSLPGKTFRGKVIWVSDKSEYTPRYIQTQRERVNLVFRVKVAVENPQGELKPGMPADVQVLEKGP